MSHFIRQFFFLHKIYFKQTWRQIFGIYALIFLFLILILSSAPLEFPLAFIYVLPLGFTLYFFLRTSIRTLIVDSRIGKAEYVKPDSIINTRITQSVANYELDGVDHARVLYEGETWKVYDSTYDFYRHTKHGTYLARQAYYTVFEATLIRNVPHILFDSKSAKKRQYKYLFLQSQRLSLEGNFDQYFDTYVPQTYHIDSLSFITPEVMEALIDSKDYDIELVDDKVFCYAPLLDETDIQKMLTVCQHLRDHINDNLKTYRDDRLAGESRRTGVTTFGRSLLKSPMRHIPALIISGILTIGIVIGCFVYSFEILLDEVSAVIIIIFLSKIWEVQKIIRTNRQLEREFRLSQHALNAQTQ